MRLIALAGLPEIEPGDDLGTLLAERLHGVEPSLARFDVLVIAQKVVSKAENRFLDLASVTPSARARDLAAATGKDPRLLEAILAESAEVLRAKPGVIDRPSPAGLRDGAGGGGSFQRRRRGARAAAAGVARRIGRAAAGDAREAHRCRPRCRDQRQLRAPVAARHDQRRARRRGRAVAMGPARRAGPQQPPPGSPPRSHGRTPWPPPPDS